MPLGKKYLALAIPLFSLLGLVFASDAFAQCSTTAWSGITGTPQAIGIATTPIGKKYEGQCGLTVNAASAPGFVTTTTPTNETVFAARFYFLPVGLNITAGDVIIFQARNGSTPQIELSLRKINGVTHLVTVYRSGGSLVEHWEKIPLLPIWQAVTLSWSAGSGNGTFSLKLDDVKQFSLGGLSNGNELINEADLGIINTPAASGEVVFDAFESRKSSTVPPLLVANELFNISTRADVNSGNEIVIGGFIISGNTDKCIVVRGRGQSVGLPAGVARLADPVLILKSGSTTIDSSDNWQDHATAAIVSMRGRAPNSPSDAALYICLSPGAYTALVRGVSSTSNGVGIVEVFDEDYGTPFLANISTRALVGTGNKVAIGGFIVRGKQSKQVLIRGRGPTVGVPSGSTRLPDPTLTLKSGSKTLAINDNWGQAANSAAISATGKAPTNALEAAILISLPPGSYTAILKGANQATGIGIVEIIDESGGSITSN